MARLCKRTIRIYSGLNEVKKFQRWEEHPDLLLEVLDLENGKFDCKEYKIEQFAILDKDDDWFSDFSSSQFRANGGDLITFTRSGIGGLPTDFFDTVCKGADSTLIKFFETIFERPWENLDNLYETINTRAKYLNLNRSLLPWPDYPQIDFTKEELENFDLSRFYAITISLGIANVDDKLVKYIPEYWNEAPGDKYFKGSEGTSEFLIAKDREFKVVSMPLFGKRYKRTKQAVYMGDINKVGYDGEWAEACGYVTAQKEGAPIVINLSDFNLAIDSVEEC